MASSTRKISFLAIAMTVVNLLQLVIIGKIKDFVMYLIAKLKSTKETLITAYHPSSFFTRNVFNRGLDSYFNVVCSAPGARLKIQERSISTTGDIIYHYDEKGNRKTREVLNFESYNYLGFTDRVEYIEKNVLKILHQYGVGMCSSRAEYGTSLLHKAVEKRVAEYVGKEDAIIFGMGFATNSTGLPTLVSKNSLVLSDMDNHSSIILGLRHSGATVKVFKHNGI
jgi:serine palmitoyltransferase